MSDDIAQSLDQDGSTPGYVNSITPVERDLALYGVSVSFANGMTLLDFTVANVGLDDMTSATLTLQITVGETIDIIELEPAGIGDTTVIETGYTFGGIYLGLVASLSSDDRDRNNSLEFMAVGQDYPPVVLSEFLANPQSDPDCEWVELYNRSDTVINLANWCVGDKLRSCNITSDPFVFDPGEYIALVQSETDFLISHPEYAGVCLQPSSWPSLNNDGDMVRLIDIYGIQADCCEYTFAYESDYTWCCEEYGSDPERWGRSASSGGTPGEENSVVFQQLMSGLKVTVEPKYVSPDGDAFDESVTITIESPPADDYTVLIYDRRGRVVRHLYDDEPVIPGTIEWDGLSDSGRRLAIGPYILYVEAAGVGESKTAIVVAR
jgi:hypothetical protein